MSLASDSVPPASVPSTIAGHSFSVWDRGGGLLNLRITLGGAPLVALARALAKLEGVRVTGGPEGSGAERCFLIHCLGFKLVLSAEPRENGEAADFAQALVSRAPQATLTVMSDLGDILERLMSAPAPLPEPAPVAKALRRSTLQQGKPLARKTGLTRKTPLARGRFRRG